MELEKPLVPNETDEPIPAELSPVLVISRETFNYIVIAISFLIVGVVIGTLLANRATQNTRALISEAVAAAMDARSMDTVATGPDLTDPNIRLDVSADDDPFLGPADAKVTMVEFGDYNCQWCRKFHHEVMQPLIEKYGTRVRYVYRDFPFLADSSLLAALAAECLHEQDKFWRYHDLLYIEGASLDAISLTAMADQVGADMDAFMACVQDQRYVDEIFSDYSAGEALGVRATPIFFINGRPISGFHDIEVFEKMIEEELAAADQPATEEAVTS